MPCMLQHPVYRACLGHALHSWVYLYCISRSCMACIAAISPATEGSMLFSFRGCVCRACSTLVGTTCRQSKHAVSHCRLPKTRSCHAMLCGGWYTAGNLLALIAGDASKQSATFLATRQELFLSIPWSDWQIGQLLAQCMNTVGMQLATFKSKNKMSSVCHIHRQQMLSLHLRILLDAMQAMHCPSSTQSRQSTQREPPTSLTFWKYHMTSHLPYDKAATMLCKLWGS